MAPLIGTILSGQKGVLVSRCEVEASVCFSVSLSYPHSSVWTTPVTLYLATSSISQGGHACSPWSFFWEASLRPFQSPHSSFFVWPLYGLKCEKLYKNTRTRLFSNSQKSTCFCPPLQVPRLNMCATRPGMNHTPVI